MTTTLTGAAIVRQGYERFAAHDVPGVLALFDPSIEWTIPGPTPVADVYRGPEGVGRFFGRLVEAYDELTVQPQELIEDGDRVIALGRHTGRGPGGGFDVGFAHVWDLRDGLAVRFYEYTDTEALAAALA